MIDKRKTVFISYSWDNTDHKEWVLNLAKDLMERFGIDIILDRFELSAGKESTHFMENAIEKSDKVLVVLTPNYKQKSESRNGGVGFESSIISQEIFELPISKIKFIPILRTGTQRESTPIFLKSKIYHPMNRDSEYSEKLNELSLIIYDKPLVEKPSLGNVPDFKPKVIPGFKEITSKQDSFPFQKFFQKKERKLELDENNNIFNKHLYDELDDYVRTNDDFYFKNYSQRLHIEYDLKNSNFIIINSSISFHLISKSEDAIPFYNSTSLRKESKNDDITEYQLKTTKINNVDIPLEEPFLKIEHLLPENKLLIKQKRILQGHKEYYISREVLLKYSLEVEYTQSFMFSAPVENYSLEISHPKDLEITFLKQGTFKSFDKVVGQTSNERTLKRYNYNGVIYRNQGVLLIFRDLRKNKN